MSKSEKKENLAPAPSLSKSKEEALSSGVFSKGDWPDKDWWNILESPTLTAWIEEALTQNPSLRSVQFQIDQARQVAQVTRSKLMPTLYFDTEDNYRYLSENGFTHLLNPSLPLSGYQVDLSLAFNYEFDFWNKNRNMFKAALGEMKAMQAEYNQAELLVSSSLAQAYFALLTTMEKKALYEKLYDIRKKRLNLQLDLQNSALFSALPPLLGDEETNEAEQKVLAMEDEIQIQSHLINILRGKGPDADLSIENLTLSPPQKIPLPSDLSLDLLARRPDLMSQIWRADSLAAQVGAAKADFFPNINIAAFAGVLSTSFSTLFQQNSKTAGYTPALSLPIYTAGSIKANILAKKAAFNEAIFAYNNLLLTSAQEVADLLSQVRTVYKQKELQVQIVDYAKQRLDLTILRQMSGLDSSFDFLNFEEKVVEKQIQAVDFTYLQYAFLIKLIKALGGGFTFSDIPISVEES